MTSQQWTIGSDTDADLTVIDPTVSRKHCRLSKTDKGYFIEDLVSRNGTFVDGERVVKRTPVTPKSKIVLAESIPMPWPDESLARKTIRIGRHSDNDLVLDHESVSTNHAVLMCDVHGRWLVRDLNSTNGTSIGTPYRRIRSAYVAPEMPLEFGSVGATLDQWLETIAERQAALASTQPPPKPNHRDMATVKGSRVGMPSNRPTVVSPSSDTTRSTWIADRKWIAPLACMIALIALGSATLLWPRGDADASSGTDQPPPKESVAPKESEQASTENPSIAPESPAPPIGSIPEAMSEPSSATQPSPDLETPVEPSKESPPTLLENLRGAMVLIVTTDRDGQVYRHSSGLAVGPQAVLTTGSAAEKLDIGDEFGPTQILHVASGETFPIKKRIPSPKLVESLTAYELARTKRVELQESAGGVPPDDELKEQIKQLAMQEIMHAQLVRVHDVGLLVTEKDLPTFVDGGALEKPWMASADSSPPALSSLSLIGPFFAEDGRAMFDEKSVVQTQAVKPLKLLPRVSPTMRRLMLSKMPEGITLEQNFSGCVIVDSSEKVVGMFSRARETTSFGVDPSISQSMSAKDLLFDMISTEVIFEFLNSQLPSP